LARGRNGENDVVSAGEAGVESRREEGNAEDAVTSGEDGPQVRDAWVEMPSEDAIRAFMRSGHVYDFGFLTGMQRLVMSHPAIAPPFAALFVQIMFGPGTLLRREREMVAAIAAAAQDCHY